MSDTGQFIIGISIGILFAIIGFIDILSFRVAKRSFLNYLIHLSTSSLPLILQTIGLKVSDKFYISYYLSFIVFTIFIIFFIYKTTYSKLLHHLNNLNPNHNLTFLGFLIYGYKNFIKEIEKEKSKALLTISENFKDLPTPSPLWSYYKDAGLFVRQLYNIKKDDSVVYVYCILQSFIDTFIGNSNARFTLRKNENGEMVTKLTTRTETFPSPIPLSQVNMISKSLEIGIPLLYSINKEYHYSTGKNTVPKIYPEYVTYCLTNIKNEPEYSVCLEVKFGFEGLLKSIVNSALFSIICETIASEIRGKDIKFN